MDVKVRDGSARRALARHPDEANPRVEHDVGLRLVYGGQAECFTLGRVWKPPSANCWL